MVSLRLRGQNGLVKGVGGDIYRVGKTMNSVGAYLYCIERSVLLCQTFVYCLPSGFRVVVIRSGNIQCSTKSQQMFGLVPTRVFG